MGIHWKLLERLWNPRPLKNETAKLRCGFRSRNQLPLFMLWWEYQSSFGDVEYAEVILTIG